MAKKIFSMYHKTQKDTKGYALKIRDCNRTEEEFQSVHKGDYKDMFPKFNELPEYDPDIHCINYGEALSCPEYNSETGKMQNMSEYDRYLLGDRKLKEGEKIENETIITIESPSNYHIWDDATRDYILTEEKEAEWKGALKDALAYKRNIMLETGTAFEDKLIKGRIQDTADALGQLKKVEKGKTVFWAYSSGEIESPITEVTRMGTISDAIGDFRSSQFLREGELKVYIDSLDEQGLIDYDVDQIW